VRPRSPGPRIAAAASAVAISLAAALAGCAQPGTQAPKAQAAKLSVGTGDISTACGYLEELSAFGKPDARSVAPIESMAQTGARKLAGVYAEDHSDIYQGDSIGAVLSDSISLLHDCRLNAPARTLELALSSGH
jgi:hypothetical protein